MNSFSVRQVTDLGWGSAVFGPKKSGRDGYLEHFESLSPKIKKL